MAPENAVDPAIFALIRTAVTDMTKNCEAIRSGDPVSGSIRAEGTNSLRRTAGGGGRQRADLLGAVQIQCAVFIDEIAELSLAVADLLEDSLDNSEQHSLALATLTRAVWERAAVCVWLLSDQIGLRTGDWVAPRPTSGGALDSFRKMMLYVPAQLSCRRYLVWKFDQIRYEKNFARSLPKRIENPEMRAEFDRVLTGLDDVEGEYVARAQKAQWDALPERRIDGSLSPACLLSESGSKPERMPPLSALAEPFMYSRLSVRAHPSHQELNMRMDHLDAVRMLKFALQSILTPIFWATGERGEWWTTLSELNEVIFPESEWGELRAKQNPLAH